MYHLFLGKSLTELTSKGQLSSSLPSSKSSILTNIPSQKPIDTINDHQHAPSNNTLITSTSVSSNSGTTVVTNELLSTTKKVVQTKTISPPVLIQVKQEPASSSSSSCVNQEFTKPTLTNLVAVKTESNNLAGQEHNRAQINRNDSTNLVNINGNVLKKEGKWRFTLIYFI